MPIHVETNQTRLDYPCRNHPGLPPCGQPDCRGFVTEYRRHDATIHAVECFTINCHKGFNAAAEESLMHVNSRSIEVDLASTRHIDSAVLGMLLVLKQRADKMGKKLRLTGMSGTVKMVLDMSRLRRQFEDD
jgi:anti-anti-sigma factor